MHGGFESVTAWVIFLAVVAIVATLLLLATYYGPMSSRFWEARYRTVEGSEHLGPALEIGWNLLSVTAVLLLAVSVFPDAASSLDDGEDATVAAVVVGVVLAGLVLFYLFVSAVEESRHVLLNEGRVFSNLGEDTKRRLRDLKAGRSEIELADEVRAIRKNYIPYSPVGIINVLLAVMIVWLIGSGLWRDVGAALSARADMIANTPTSFDSVAKGQELMERYYAAFSGYQDAMLDLAVDLTAVLAIAVVLGFWFLGTPFQTIFTQGAVSAMRWTITLVVLVVVPVAIAASYFHLASVANELKGVVDVVVAEMVDLGLSADQLTTLHDAEDRIQGRAGLESFWAELGTSSGGLLLLLVIVVSVAQNHFRPSSFLKNVLPWSVQKEDSSLRNWGRALFSPPEAEESATRQESEQ